MKRFEQKRVFLWWKSGDWPFRIGLLVFRICSLSKETIRFTKLRVKLTNSELTCVSPSNPDEVNVGIDSSLYGPRSALQFMRLHRVLLFDSLRLLYGRTIRLSCIRPLLLLCFALFGNSYVKIRSFGIKPEIFFWKYLVLRIFFLKFFEFLQNYGLRSLFHIQTLLEYTLNDRSFFKILY